MLLDAMLYRPNRLLQKLAKACKMLLYNACFYYISIRLTTLVLQKAGLDVQGYPTVLYFCLSFHFLVYFGLMYKDLYSKNHHYYYKYAYQLLVKNVFFATAAAVVVCGSLSLVWQLQDGRHDLILFYSLYLIVGAASFYGIQELQYAWIRYLSRLGYFHKKVLLVGQPDSRYPVDLLFQDVGNTKEYVGQLVERGNRYGIQNGWAHPELYNHVEEVLLRNNIGEVLIFLDRSVASAMLLNIARFCREQAISYAVVPDISILPNVEPWNRPFAGIPAIELFHTTWDSLTLISIKRLLDLLISAVALLGFLPFGLLIALAIRLEDGGPIFYVSRRIGKDGRTIRFFKFRSMVVDAEAKKRELLRFNERKDGPLFKMKDDPRITRMGRILRKLSLDEVPQLCNVLLGHMSLVGPRPHLPEEVAEYSDRDYLRLECMPGVVGLPQICGRNSLGFREWIDYDLQYRKEWTVSLDLKIICKAVSVMFSPLFAPKEPVY